MTSFLKLAALTVKKNHVCINTNKTNILNKTKQYKTKNIKTNIENQGNQ
jgi:hypothetical protein